MFALTKKQNKSDNVFLFVRLVVPGIGKLRKLMSPI